MNINQLRETGNWLLLTNVDGDLDCRDYKGDLVCFN